MQQIFRRTVLTMHGLRKGGSGACPTRAVALGGGMRAPRSHAATPRYGRPVLPNVTAIRYVTPLREGGSLPAIVEADDLGLYVLKFRGAGQGPLALVAELIAGEIG